jgi:glycerate kinase
LDATTAAAAIAEGVRDAVPTAELDCCPLGDGGEGSGALLGHACAATEQLTEVADPLGRPRQARWWTAQSGERAIVELAEATGLQFLATHDRNPMRASSFGVGQLIRRAIDVGCRRVALCAGGSATVDGGAGCLQALGFRLLDRAGRRLRQPAGGGDLARIEAIERPTGLPAIQIDVLCDVANPLTGARGAAPMFGPQKGAGPQQVCELEENLRRWEQLLERTAGRVVADVEHGGAAGGLPAALYALLDARLLSGFDEIARRLRVAERLLRCAVCITGEGCLDEQTRGGKVVSGVARLAQAAGVPAVALVGRLDSSGGRLGSAAAAELGLREIVVITPEDQTPAEAMARARENLRGAAAGVARRWIAPVLLAVLAAGSAAAPVRADSKQSDTLSAEWSWHTPAIIEWARPIDVPQPAGSVLVLTTAGRLQCLDRRTGEPAAEILLPLTHGAQFAGAADGLAYLHDGFAVTAVRVRPPGIAWTAGQRPGEAELSRADPEDFPRIAAAQAAAGGVVIVRSDGRVALLSAADGRVAWEQEIGRPGDAHVLACGGRAVVLSSPAGQAMATFIDAVEREPRCTSVRIADSPPVWAELTDSGLVALWPDRVQVCTASGVVLTIRLPDGLRAAASWTILVQGAARDAPATSPARDDGAPSMLVTGDGRRFSTCDLRRGESSRPIMDAGVSVESSVPLALGTRGDAVYRVEFIAARNSPNARGAAGRLSLRPLPIRAARASAPATAASRPLEVEQNEPPSHVIFLTDELFVVDSRRLRLFRPCVGK